MMTTTNAAVPASEQLALVTKGLDVDSATTLRSAFEAMFSQAEEWARRAAEIQVTREDQTHEMRLARESRLGLRAIRIEAEKTRKRLKADSLLRSKAVDGLYNVIAAMIEPIEARLLEQESFAERAADGRRNALRDARESALRALGADPGTYADLGLMLEDTWLTVESTARRANEERKEEARRAEAARVEAERIAAEKREAERQVALRAEAERAERERAQVAENARLRAEADARVAEARVEHERREAERATERAKVKAEADARAKAEDEARAATAKAERAEAELAEAKAESVRAEAKRQADVEAARMQAGRAHVEIGAVHVLERPPTSPIPPPRVETMTGRAYLSIAEIRRHRLPAYIASMAGEAFLAGAESVGIEQSADGRSFTVRFTVPA
jgi:hypothetical protein